MKKNVGTADRIIRVIMGFSILLFGVLAQSWFGVIGLVFFATGLLGYCPFYALFGIKTCRMD